MAKILDGRAIRDKRAATLAKMVAGFPQKPKLAIIQIGENGESDAYVDQKIRFGEKIGCEVLRIRFTEADTEREILRRIAELNMDTYVHGIIVQVPLPPSLEDSAARIIEEIDPAKDVDGMTSASIKALSHGQPGFVPATTRGILTLLDEHGIEIAGQKAVIVGRSALVGKPTALALINRHATVTVCHSKTANLSRETKAAVILIVAAGSPKLIGRDHVAPGQTVIDVGINVVGGHKLEDEIPETPKRKLVGDVDFEAVKDIVGAITPVPGGVGPMTVLSLFENLAEACARQQEDQLP